MVHIEKKIKYTKNICKVNYDTKFWHNNYVKLTNTIKICAKFDCLSISVSIFVGIILPFSEST